MGKTKKTTMKFQNLIFALILLISFSYQSKFQERFLNEEEAHERSEEEFQSVEENEAEEETKRSRSEMDRHFFKRHFPGFSTSQLKSIIELNEFLSYRSKDQIKGILAHW